mmetsp:Transcript_15659/g.39471  ORF Transcript_15659/g.39471 Transcript_15659/m.39471 type:complete len:342 (+) Transcript_15659:716-1741(+)
MPLRKAQSAQSARRAAMRAQAKKNLMYRIQKELKRTRTRMILMWTRTTPRPHAVARPRRRRAPRRRRQPRDDLAGGLACSEAGLPPGTRNWLSCLILAPGSPRAERRESGGQLWSSRCAKQHSARSWDGGTGLRDPSQTCMSGSKIQAKRACLAPRSMPNVHVWPRGGCLWHCRRRFEKGTIVQSPPGREERPRVRLQSAAGEPASVPGELGLSRGANTCRNWWWGGPEIEPWYQAHQCRLNCRCTYTKRARNRRHMCGLCRRKAISWRCASRRGGCNFARPRPNSPRLPRDRKVAPPRLDLEHFTAANHDLFVPVHRRQALVEFVGRDVLARVKALQDKP